MRSLIISNRFILDIDRVFSSDELASVQGRSPVVA